MHLEVPVLLNSVGSRRDPRPGHGLVVRGLCWFVVVSWSHQDPGPGCGLESRSHQDPGPGCGLESRSHQDPGPGCGLESRSMSLAVLEQPGDVVLGGLFSLHDGVEESRQSFTAEPPPSHCTRFNFRTFRWMQTMIFAVEEINRDGTLLPNLTLGYRIYDSCSAPRHALKAAVDLVGGGQEGTGGGVSTEGPGGGASTEGPGGGASTGGKGGGASIRGKGGGASTGGTGGGVSTEGTGGGVSTEGTGGGVSTEGTGGGASTGGKGGGVSTEGTGGGASTEGPGGGASTEGTGGGVSTEGTGGGASIRGKGGGASTEGTRCPRSVVAVIGDGGSTQSLVVARFLGVFHLPQVSYFSSCACLSDKKEFPAFLRTMPSDFFQVDALVQLVRHFGWTWVGLVAGDDAYGRGGAAIFSREVRKLGVCIALHEVIPKTPTPTSVTSVTSIVSKIRSSGTRVVLVFALEQDADVLFHEALRQGLRGVQWLASEAWSTASVLSTPPRHRHILQGSMGFAIRRVAIPGLQDFLLRLRPPPAGAAAAPTDPFLVPFWEEVFHCSVGGANVGGAKVGGAKVGGAKPPCTGREDLRSVTNIYSDVSQLRISYNVYKAVYAVAHAVRAIMDCRDGRGPFPGGACPDVDNIQPWQLLHYIKNVEFVNSFGDETKFDMNGDPVAVYDLVNWQLAPSGQMEFVTVGRFDQTTASAVRPKLQIQEDAIVWNGNQTQTPASVCSSVCPPGTRKAIRPNVPVCCHDCVACTAGEISNQSDAIECERCLPEFWSNAARTACVPKRVDFLSYDSAMGAALAATSLLGSLCTCAVALVFSYHRATPVVRANNSELSFLLLLALAFCFLCSLAFLGRPSDWSCRLRHTAFGVAFVLCVSCVLGKTIVVLMAFKATLPGSDVIKWFGPRQQKIIIAMCTLVQVLICVVWLVVAPPTPRQLTPRGSPVVVLLCSEGSAAAFSVVLGYVGVLASLCLVLAFLARKLPDNFNEARLITFSMLIFCAVWIAFVPAYVSSPGKFAVATEVFAILASSFGLLGCIFGPKCYIILLRPEKNTWKHLMAKPAARSAYRR